MPDSLLTSGGVPESTAMLDRARRLQRGGDADPEVLGDWLRRCGFVGFKTLADLGFKSSAQAEKAGYVLVEQARYTQTYARAGRWLKLSRIVATARSVMKTARKIEAEAAAIQRRRAEVAARKAELRQLAMRRAIKRHKITEAAVQGFSNALRDWPAAKLGPKHDQEIVDAWTRAQRAVERAAVVSAWAQKHNIGPGEVHLLRNVLKEAKEPPTSEHEAMLLERVRRRIGGQRQAPNYQALLLMLDGDIRVLAKSLFKRREPAFIAALRDTPEAALVCVKAAFAPELARRAAREAEMRQFISRYGGGEPSFSKLAFKRNIPSKQLADPVQSEIIAKDILEEIRQERRAYFEKRFAKRSIESKVFFDKLKSESHEEFLAADQSADFGRCCVIIDGCVRTAYEDIQRSIAHPPQWFPLARSIGRKLEFIAGPTNSGKTHEAMKRLAEARSGVYLAPLRLLAHEVGERLRSELGVPTSIITGEERILVEGATHTASTIEMLDPSQRWEVAVIDEVQMLQDPERGWAWTHALLGVAAETVIILGAPAAEPLVREIAARTGESLSVRHLARLGELTVLRAATALGDVPKNTAIVAFSRRAVLRIAQFLSEECHRKVAVIYGALSPEVRRREAARFRSGEADVVVTTDAIGMGLNLPVETILFWELEKYDGYGNRPLSAGEILQIAGRAGRFGLFPVGFVGVVAGGPSRGGLAILKHAVATALPAMRVRLPVSLTPEMAEQIVRPTGVRRLAVVGLLRHPQPDAPWDWSVPPSYFQTADCWPADPSASIRTQAAFAAAPANLPEDSNFLLSAALAIEQGGTMEFTHPRCHSLEELEKLWKSATLYLWLAIRWPQVFTDGREAAEMRDSCDHLISQMLKAGKIALRCRTCGRTLPHRHEFAICEQCYSARRYIDEDY